MSSNNLDMFITVLSLITKSTNTPSPKLINGVTCYSCIGLDSHTMFIALAGMLQCYDRHTMFIALESMLQCYAFAGRETILVSNIDQKQNIKPDSHQSMM